ncbi:transcriptional regulator [Actinoalloteichus caeruleus]|uniref:transcriptional regulator n=1 Tax=Actinoalloteichus cyanogriseus TaxID=2893586 RepID=UPI003AB0C421
MQQLLDTALEQATPAERERFRTLTAPEPAAPPARPVSARAERRLGDDPHIAAALEWIDHHAAWPAGTARHAVTGALADLDAQELRDRGSRRGRITQADMADALARYYDPRPGYGRYAARVGATTAHTSVLTSADWLDLACPLTARHDQLRATGGRPDPTPVLTEQTIDPAVRRLAEVIAMDTRLTNNPLYRLLSIDVEPGRIGGDVGITHFVEYALTMDLLEGELTDALTAGTPIQPGSLPLREHYLPDSAAVLAVGDRLCAGGALALLAIARPADILRGEADYLLLVQERSGNVLNAARRLAVIPKGFHEPLTDVRSDARVGATLLRELEEELFGREDIDNTITEVRSADPMHPSRLSEPMRWLTERPGRLRVECTGFGLNLVSGNYEFASLIVIEDEEFWPRFGGQVEANWESSSLRRYSTLDEDLVTELVTDTAWSNEGLFAMLQGLRRLADLDGQRVTLPIIGWEIAQ